LDRLAEVVQRIAGEEAGGPPRRPREPCGATTSRSGLEFALLPSAMPEQSGI
jgi:hypothetical protein